MQNERKDTTGKPAGDGHKGERGVAGAMGEILSARARGVTYKAIASALCKSMDIKIKASTLSEYIKRDVAKIDGCARKIARNVANEKDKQR